MSQEFSPSKKLVCQSSGPKDAQIVLIGESPARDEMFHRPEPMPFVGKAGKLLNMALEKAGIDREKCYVMNCIPVRPNGDKFSNHTREDYEWAKDRFAHELASLTSARVYVPLGANPTEWLVGKLPVAQRSQTGKQKAGFIGEWRGSVIPRRSIVDGYTEGPEDYLSTSAIWAQVTLAPDSVIIPTFHPAAILRQFSWHPWFVGDIEKVARIAKEGLPKRVYRTWYRNDPGALRRLANSGVDLISVDTEMEGPLVGIATDTEVHVFEYNSEYHSALRDLLESPRILKVAHNWLFDYAFIRTKFGITVGKPYFDTLGGAHILNNALEKSLSPHIASKFTDWPYHKWLTNVDPYVYNGMDAIVCYDAYWPMLDELSKRGLLDVAYHDHRLFTPLLEMQAKGFKVDEVERVKVEAELSKDLAKKTAELQVMVEPIIEARLDSFVKPHLFRKTKKCACCGGGKKQKEHCWRCGGLSDKPKTKKDYFPFFQAWAMAWKGSQPETEPLESAFKTRKIGELASALPTCKVCQGTGKVSESIPFNPDSPDQVADVIYRGLKIRARKYKGNETTKAAQLDGIRDKHPIIGKIVDYSAAQADYDTVDRLRAGSDGLLHCEFDPFGTGSGRVAGKEGLVEVGTNPMNLPKKARRFIVPRPGKIFLYPDMSQIEARAVAVLSGDTNLKAALNEVLPSKGKPDSHSWLVEKLGEHGIKVTRDQSKRISYAGFYGVSAAQLAIELTADSFKRGSETPISTEEAQTILDTLFLIWPDVRLWQMAVLQEVLRTRRLRCKFTGRERTWTGYIFDTKSGELKHEIKKQVWSYLPQHMAAWVLAEGLIDIYYNSGVWGSLLQPLIHVHDALLMEAPVEHVEEAKNLASKYLTREIWNMQFPSEMKVGMNWYECS